jgi:hypothetical protein
VRLRILTTCALAAAASGLGASGAVADVLLDQPVDFLSRYVSFLTPSGHLMADDYAPAEDVIVESVSCFMVTTTPNEPWMYSLSVHRVTDDNPVYDVAPEVAHFFRMFGPSSVTDLGPWPGEEHMHLFEVRFDNIGLLLRAGASDDEGVYWFSCAGHLRNYPTDQCYWATSNTNNPTSFSIFHRPEPRDSYFGWNLLSDTGVAPADLAMRIEGVPADEYMPTTELTSFEVDYGRQAQGGLDDLREAGDDRVVTFKSNPGRCDGQRYYIASITTSAQCLLDDPDVLDVSVSANVQRLFRVPDAILFLRNGSTGEWVEVGRHDLYDQTDTWPFRDIPAADYLDESGEIELKFEVRAGPLTGSSERMTGYFEANIDRVRIDARRVD